MTTIDEHLSEVVTGFANVALRHVVPLFSLLKGKRPTLAGTGFFVSAGGASFLVSAAHVLDYVAPPGALHYYVDPNILRKVSGQVLRTKSLLEASRGEDRLDVGVVKLEGPSLPPYPSVEKFPLPVLALRPLGPQRSQKQYLVIGFPQSKSRPNPKSRELSSQASAFSALSAAASDYTHLGVTEESHIALSVDVKQMTFPGGRIQAMADPHGMSGAPVWLLHDEIGPNDPAQSPVVGVVIEHHKNSRAIVATDISIAIHLIEEAVKSAK